MKAKAAAAAKPKPTTAAPGMFRELKTADLIASPTNPRTEFDVSDLVDSVKQHGILQPLIVRPHPKQKAKFEIVAGERRWRTAKQANLAKVPTMLHEYSDEQVLEIQIVENLQRENISEMDEALGYKRLIKMGLKAEEIAARVGKSKSYVYAAMKIAELAEPWQKRLKDQQIQRSHAVLLARLQPKDQTTVMEYFKHRESFSVNELDDYIRRDLMLQLEAAPFILGDANLLPSAGPCSTCPKRSGNNPDLYADVKEKMICTDRACYMQKCHRVLQQYEAKLKANGETVARITKEHWQRDPDKDVLTANVYRELKTTDKDCDHTVSGIYVDPKLIGHKRRVCIEPKCRTHKRSSRYEMSAEERQQRKLQKEEQKYEQSCAHVAIDAVLSAAGRSTSLDRAEMEWFALSAAQMIGWDVQKEIRKRHPVWKLEELGTEHMYAFEDQLSALLPTLTDHEIKLLLIELFTASILRSGLDPKQVDDMKRTEWGRREPLIELASLYTVDLKAVLSGPKPPQEIAK